MQTAQRKITEYCPAICGALLGTLANPNLVHCEYSEMAVELEQAVIRQIATQTGWDPALATGSCSYGVPFTCAVGRDNIFAVQFHPEKSAQDGLQLLKNFVEWRP